MDLQSTLQQHLKYIIEKNYQFKAGQFALLVYDRESPLSKLMEEGYRTALQGYSFEAIDFDIITEDDLIKTFSALPAHSLIILVESLSFRSTKYRLRADLFRMGHRVIEHARLSYNTPEQIENYVNSLRYDTPYYVSTCEQVEKLLAMNTVVRVESGKDELLTISSEFEKPIKNTGDFSQSVSASSGFPIGELFTEAKSLEGLNGSVVVFGFPTIDHQTHFCQPFVVTIKDGCLVDHSGPDEFARIIDMIRGEEGGKVQVREIGFGLNRALGFNHRINEPTAFERFCGMHFSLGLKHAMYRKKISKKVLQKYHLDIFCLVRRVFIGETKVFEDGKYCV